MNLIASLGYRLRICDCIVILVMRCPSLRGFLKIIILRDGFNILIDLFGNECFFVWLSMDFGPLYKF